MSVVYDNWERLVRATLLREELRLTALRTPSDLSLASASSSPSLSASSSFNFIPPSNQVSSFNFSNLSLVGDSFTYHQILQATHDLSSSNVMKSDRSGDYFYGVIEGGTQVDGISGDIFHGVLGGGTQVVVKKVDISSAKAVSFLMSELEFFATVSHPKFVPLLGYCFENWGHKFLVYKYMPNNDLSLSFCKITPPLDWKTRLKVATGVAQALCHLHHHCVPPLVHRNVEASSILIDENYDGHLGRVIEVCAEKKDRNENMISRLLRLPKGSERDTSGASNTTRAYDVYCFGNVLLEIVTGIPVSSDHINIRVMDRMETVLPYITTHDRELFVKIMDPYLTRDEDLLDEVWTVAVVAKACLHPKPSKRPLMTNVLEALEVYGRLEEFSTYVGSPSSAQLTAVAPAVAKLKISEGSKVAGASQAAPNASSSDSRFSPPSGIAEAYPNGETWDVPNLIVFSFAQLRAATRNFALVSFLGEGGFGRTYKGHIPEKSSSKSGRVSLIAVKRRKPESMQGFKEWQTEIDMLGKLSHPNLIKLLGYCSENEELLLVYDYMPRGSLDNHLFGRGSGIQPLSWDTRLKILIGAARGLAYMHALKRQVVFRDFKTSSILLDASYNAKLSDFGIARMGPPENITHVSTRVMGTYGYAAPEYIATGRLSVKCDVYGFGVVMVEVLTGLRALDRSRPVGQRNLVDWIKPRLSDGRKTGAGIMDRRLEGRYPVRAAVKMRRLALMCVSHDPKARPSMKEVVDTLEGIQSIQQKAKEPRTRTVSQNRTGNQKLVTNLFFTPTSE